MTPGACRDVWACLLVIVGLTSPAAGDSPPIELAHGGRLPGRILETDDPAVVRVAADLFAEPVEFVAVVVHRDGEAADELPQLPGLPGRVGLLTSGETRLLGCLAACADGRVGWQPLGATRPVAFAGKNAATSIDYLGLDVVGGPGVTLTRQGRSGDWTLVDVIADGPAARDGRLRVDDRVATIAEGAFGRPVDLATAKADSVRLLLVGPVGSMVRLGVVREAGTEEIVLARDLQGRDDLAGAAVVLATLDRAVAARMTGTLIGLFTRAEEVGLRGAAVTGRSRLLPDDALVVAVETSSMAGGRAVQGGGPIIRVGDAIHVFSPRMTQWMTTLAQELATADPAFRFQRKLMDGGVTEATAYDLYGYETGAACVALGNYHNAGSRARIAAETVNLDDLEGLVRLFLRMLETVPTMGRYLPALLRRFDRLGREAVPLLRARR